ncbi:MAG TPA: hypothetical protein VIL86_04785 [Tepidisphaeraceae bacterium]|jgi:cell division protein FtsL
MLKLLICLVSALVLAVVTLQIRQQRLELNHQANVLHNQIEAQQAKLWSQQLQIAVFTAPNAIVHTVDNQHLKLVPESPLPPAKSLWLDVRGNSDAE